MTTGTMTGAKLTRLRVPWLRVPLPLVVSIRTPSQPRWRRLPLSLALPR